ncbi:TIGR01777 family oxidoreductase [Paenibacillus arenilitoris]|uniref:TIGR01777 family protein n=1 Tax=Paenibacillus arenilitoris TaxID=2772299 RepID=A0A927H4R3_9BACL|nr:TIGR01777 family oxidoreductase [Paenibacillus arenilitoris]MBD2867768.1 TIGR01777 family protein [Paenibacillus arenilitoris]
MRIAIAGGTGFIGSALKEALLKRSDEVWIISRRDAGARGPVADNRKPDARLHNVTWSMLEDEPSLLEGMDAIVNLAGESINQRWTAGAKKRILDSRLSSSARIAKLAHALEHKPSLLIQASGIAAYGSSPDAVFDESGAMADNDFLSNVVRRWEQAADSVPAGRHVLLRTGVVLDPKKGAFPLMALPYRLYGGGRIGSGKQWVSWIHIKDMVRLILFCLDHQRIRGPVNACAPEPAMNDEFGRAIGKAMGRPHYLPVPSFAMRVLLGEMSALLLDSQRALPRKALKGGFRFLYPDVERAMLDLVGRK